MNVSKDQLAEKYLNCIRSALNQIKQNYFRVANRFNADVISERVFCYEFYHQIRMYIESSEENLLSDQIFIHGELSKATYHGFEEDESFRYYGDITPDFLIHKPENDEFNLIAIEIKPNLKGGYNQFLYVKKDIKKLCSLIKNNYEIGILIVFNNSFDELKDFFIKHKLFIFVETDLDNDLFSSDANSIRIITIKNAGEIEENLFSELRDSVFEDAE